MRITRLKLHNYKQHHDQDLEFKGNIIGVVGRNGSGKSNLLGALHFAFAGEQPGSKKADLLSWGAVEGNISVEFVHDQLAGVINRSLHSNYAYMKYGTQEYNGITSVGQAIESIFGLDKDLLKQTIFVRQAEIDTVLFTEPRARELAFQRLCGIGESAKVHKRLGELMGSLAAPQDYDVQIAEGYQRKAEMGQRLVDLQAKIAETQVIKDRMPSTADIQRQVREITTARQKIEQLRSARQNLVTNTNWATKSTELLSELVLVATPLSDIDNELAELNRLVRVAEDYQRAFADYERSGKAIIELGQPPAVKSVPYTPEQMAALQKQAEDFNAQYTSALNNLKTYKELAGVVAKLQTAECPVCGGPIKDTSRLNSLIQQYTALANVNNPQPIANELQRARTAVQQVEQENTRQDQNYKSQMASRMESYKKAEQAFKSAIKIDKDITELNRLIAERTSYRRNLTASLLEQRDLMAQKKAAEDQIAVLTLTVLQLDKELNNAPDLDVLDATLVDKYKLAGEAMVQLTEINKQWAGLMGMFGELTNSVKSLDSTLDNLEQKRKQQAGQKEVMTTLTAVRDWFHYLNGPHAITANVLNEMTADVNKYLDYFGAPFVVKAATDVMGFQVLFTDGRAMPDVLPDATVLSGGQKVMLAVSFRLASYSIFASRQGLLSLDEASAYLDDNAIGMFVTLLDKLKQVAHELDLQIMMATHEMSFTPMFDTVIDLSK